MREKILDKYMSNGDWIYKDMTRFSNEEKALLKGFEIAVIKDFKHSHGHKASYKGKISEITISKTWPVSGTGTKRTPPLYFASCYPKYKHIELSYTDNEKNLKAFKRLVKEYKLLADSYEDPHKTFRKEHSVEMKKLYAQIMKDLKKFKPTEHIDSKKLKYKCPKCGKNLELCTDHDEGNNLGCYMIQCPNDCFEMQDDDWYFYITYHYNPKQSSSFFDFNNFLAGNFADIGKTELEKKKYRK